MLRFSAAPLILLLSCHSVPEADAAPGDLAGATVSVVNIVTADYERESRKLQTGDPVRQDDVINVSTDASTELKLNDETKLALGPGARLLLDKFVYDPDKSGSSIGVDLVRGAFRFMTGMAPKSSYVVKVPQASIAVRGTIFDVYIEPDETTWILLHEGAVRICDNRGVCRDLSQPGRLMRISGTGKISPPARWAALETTPKAPFPAAFPFVVKPPLIDPRPIFTEDDIIKPGTGKDGSIRRAGSGEDTKPSSSPPRKTQSPQKTRETKPAKDRVRRANSTSDEAASKAIGTAIGIGIGIGIGKIGGGSGGGGRTAGGKGRPDTDRPPSYPKGKIYDPN